MIENWFPIMAKVVYNFYSFIILSVMTSETFRSSTTRQGCCKNIIVGSYFMDFHWGFCTKKKLLLTFTPFSVLSGPLKAVSVVWKLVRNLCVWEAESGDPDFRPES